MPKYRKSIRCSGNPRGQSHDFSDLGFDKEGKEVWACAFCGKTEHSK